MPCPQQVRFVHALPITALKCFTSLTILPQVTSCPVCLLAHSRQGACHVAGVECLLADVKMCERQVLGCAMHSTAAMRTCTLLAQMAQVISVAALRSANAFCYGSLALLGNVQCCLTPGAVGMQVLVFLVMPLLGRHRLEIKTRRQFENERAVAAALDAAELPQQHPT